MKTTNVCTLGDQYTTHTKLINMSQTFIYNTNNNALMQHVLKTKNSSPSEMQRNLIRTKAISV